MNKLKICEHCGHEKTVTICNICKKETNAYVYAIIQDVSKSEFDSRMNLGNRMAICDKCLKEIF